MNNVSDISAPLIFLDEDNNDIQEVARVLMLVNDSTTGYTANTLAAHIRNIVKGIKAEEMVSPRANGRLSYVSTLGFCATFFWDSTKGSWRIKATLTPHIISEYFDKLAVLCRIPRS